MRWILISLTLGAAALAAEPATKALTLRQCHELALAQNLELRVERLNPTIAQWGIVEQQGAFDPVLQGALTYDDWHTPSAGGSAEQYRELSPGLSLGGALPTGAEYRLGVADNRSQPVSGGFVYTGNLTLSVSQPLLKGAGTGANTAYLRVAREARAAAGHQFTRRVMQIVRDVSNAYYELAFAIEDHKAKLEDLNRAKRLLDENRRRVEVGVLSPLDVTQAEAGVAEREEAVILAERRIRDGENTLKRLVLGNVREWQGQTLVPGELPVAAAVAVDAAASIRTALQNRPDLLATRAALAQRGILEGYRRNQLLPAVDVQLSGGLAGRDEDNFGRLTADQLGGRYPAWGVGVTVSIPLGNQTERAKWQAARLQTEQAKLALQQLEQNIIVEVDNAAGRVHTNWKRLEATRVASRLAEESLKAEEAKQRAGTSTSFLVLQAQAQLAAARSAEIRARADYYQSLVALAEAEGTTLEKNQIALDDKF
jgi:outer membrane protein TolC